MIGWNIFCSASPMPDDGQHVFPSARIVCVCVCVCVCVLCCVVLCCVCVLCCVVLCCVVLCCVVLCCVVLCCVVLCCVVVCVCVCVCVYLSVCLSVCVCVFAWRVVCLSTVCLSVCKSVKQSTGRETNKAKDLLTDSGLWNGSFFTKSLTSLTAAQSIAYLENHIARAQHVHAGQSLNDQAGGVVVGLRGV